MKQLIDFLVEHKAAVTVAGGWVIREAHQAYAMAKESYPFLRDNGGIFGVTKDFLKGRAK